MCNFRQLRISMKWINVSIMLCAPVAQHIFSVDRKWRLFIGFIIDNFVILCVYKLSVIDFRFNVQHWLLQSITSTETQSSDYLLKLVIYTNNSQSISTQWTTIDSSFNSTEFCAFTCRAKVILFLVSLIASSIPKCFFFLVSHKNECHNFRFISPKFR